MCSLLVKQRLFLSGLTTRDQQSDVVAVEQDLVEFRDHLAPLGGHLTANGDAGTGRSESKLASRGETLGWERKEKNALDRSRSDARRRVEAAFGLTRVATHYSTTSSSTMLTYTSNPLSVPTISLSDFIMIQMRDPTHRSTSSEGSSWLGFVAMAFVGRAAMFASLHVNVCVRVALSANAASGWTNGACECEDGAQGFFGSAIWRSFAGALHFDFFFSLNAWSAVSRGPVRDNRSSDSSRRAS